MSESFGTRLRRLRGAKRLTQMQLADACHPKIHRRTIVSLEIGENEPQASTLATLAEALGVTQSELAGEREDL